MTSADRCRAMGWGPGTVLRGDEGYGPEDIVITAVGEECVMARYLDADIAREGPWTLFARDWRQVGAGGRLWPEVGK